MDSQEIEMESYQLLLPEEATILGHHSTGTIWINDKYLDIEPSRKVYKKSLEFSWGYVGSGPGQLALAILLKYLPETIALNYFNDFMHKTISCFPQADIEKRINLRQIMCEIIQNRRVFG